MDAIVEKLLPGLDNMNDSGTREKMGMRVSVIGIIANLMLCTAKLIIGFVSGSISVIADGLNNLSDAGSGVAMLFGFRMAASPADPEHPFGHGRVEYLSGLFLAVVIIIVGFELLKSSVEKIISPEAIAVDAVTAGVLVLSIVGKLVLSEFYFRAGRRLNSATIHAAGVDSRSDCLTTAVVFASVLVYELAGVNIDGIAGALVSLFVLYSGWEAANGTIQPLLGEAPDPELTTGIKCMTLATKSIVGVHDLIVHNYGPGRVFASLHAEVPHTMNIMEAHEIIDDLEQRIAEKYNLNVTVHMDPIVVDDPETNAFRLFLTNVLQAVETGLTMHDFRMVTLTEGRRRLLFDVVVPHKTYLSDKEIRKVIEQQLETSHPGVEVDIHFDHQYC
ncbi:MAG: cation diffusion facilitator family transporter [Schwartzia succinivorans]|nr:cation diffusion facilitator family transporter [Schwartzia succinivorans]